MVKYNSLLYFIFTSLLVIPISGCQTITKKVLPPEPVIVSHSLDYSSTRLFEYSVRVKGDVRNDGGDGYVVVEVILSQDGNEWKKTYQMYMESKQTLPFELVFDEVKLFGSEPSYVVDAYPLGEK